MNKENARSMMQQDPVKELPLGKNSIQRCNKGLSVNIEKRLIDILKQRKTSIPTDETELLLIRTF